MKRAAWYLLISAHSGRFCCREHDGEEEDGQLEYRERRSEGRRRTYEGFFEDDLSGNHGVDMKMCMKVGGGREERERGERAAALDRRESGPALNVPKSRGSLSLRSPWENSFNFAVD